VQATAAGVSIALGGALRDLFTSLATSGALGDALSSPATGYSVVYHIELYLMFATLIALGPLVRQRRPRQVVGTPPFHLNELPGSTAAV
jgi:BCD family chlorophyll transporter-like MFS transporter